MTDNVQDETSNENQSETPDEDKLTRDLEKQVKQFANLFAMLDTDSDGEQQAALAALRKNMNRINGLQEQLTGVRGDLSFRTLLDKIENGGGADGEVVEEYERVIAELSGANDALKQAEMMLRSELERALLVSKYDKARNTPEIDVTAMAKKALTEIRSISEKLEAMVDPDPQKVEDMYSNVLDEMTTKDLGGENGKMKMAHRLVGGILRGMNYPVDADDAVKLQTLAAAQAQAIKDTEDLQARLETVKDMLPPLREALDIIIYQSGKHPDLVAAIEAMKHAESRAELFRMERQDMAQRLSSAERAHTNAMREMTDKLDQAGKVLLRVDTMAKTLMVKLFSNNKGAFDFTAVKDDKSMSAEERAHENEKRREDAFENMRRKSIDWTDAQVLRTRLDTASALSYMNRLGDTFRGVTLEDLIKENHQLHAALAFKGASAANAQGKKVLESYRLIPANDVANIISDHQRMEHVTQQAQTSAADAVKRADRMESDNMTLRQQRTQLEQRVMTLEVTERQLERSNEQLINTLEQARDQIKKRDRTIALTTVATMAFAALAVVSGAVALSNLPKDQDTKPVPPQTNAQIMNLR